MITALAVLAALSSLVFVVWTSIDIYRLNRRVSTLEDERRIELNNRVGAKQRTYDGSLHWSERHGAARDTERMIRTPSDDPRLAPWDFRRWQTLDGRWEALVTYVPYHGPKSWSWVADPGVASEREYSPILWEAS